MMTRTPPAPNGMRDDQRWHPGGTRFLWMPKEALRIIESSCENEEAAGLLNVYIGLVRTADALDSNSFEKPLGYIAKLSFVGARTIQRHLPRLVALGLVGVEHRRVPGCKENDVHRFTLERYRPPEVTGCRDLPTDRVPEGVAVTLDGKTANAERASFGDSECPSRSPTQAEVVAYSTELGLAQWKGEDWFDQMVACGWIDHEHRHIVEWRSALRRVYRKWISDGRPMAPPSSKRRQSASESTAKKNTATTAIVDSRNL